MELAERIGAEYKPDAVVGIGKSGFIPTAVIAKRLGVEEVYFVTVTLYTDEKPPKRAVNRPRISFANIEELEGKKVLVIDDFIHTGSTIYQVMKLIHERGRKEVRTAVVALREDAKFKPDYYAKVFKGCIVFPWDVESR